ncbi:MAG: nucleotidyltransferase [Acidimicrobiaceae bacterium]|nr:nucleotidyltransferase [Acidimicrobiaceae bacterium]
MARTVAQALEKFLEDLVPLPSQRDAAAQHRASVETSLKNGLSVSRFRDIGSFGHGTGIRGHHDVDLLVSISNDSKPATSATTLEQVKKVLSASFPSTTVRVSRPSVVVEFNGGAEKWEVTPGFIKSAKDAPVLYDIPGVGAGNWMESAPLEHLAYGNEVNGMTEIAGGAKKLARLVKAWKYYNNVPISSFYLEMRSAKYLSTEKFFEPLEDICRLLEQLVKLELADMNDPKGIASRFAACSSVPNHDDALSKAKTGASRARKALDAKKAGNEVLAFQYLDLLFNGKFPAR